MRTKEKKLPTTLKSRQAVIVGKNFPFKEYHRRLGFIVGREDMHKRRDKLYYRIEFDTLPTRVFFSGEFQKIGLL